MGCFSWMFADTNNKKPLKNGMTGYLLLPEGGYLKTESYNCYGSFGGKNAYAMLARFNRGEDLIKYIKKPPVRETYCSDEFYKMAVRRHSRLEQIFADYGTLSDEEMLKKYGVDYEETIGIELSFSKKYADLPYKLKITSKPMDYNDVEDYSIEDEGQGL